MAITVVAIPVRLGPDQQCDIFAPGGRLYHVRTRYERSHLISQVLTQAAAFACDQILEAIAVRSVLRVEKRRLQREPQPIQAEDAEHLDKRGLRQTDQPREGDAAGVLVADDGGGRFPAGQSGDKADAARSEAGVGIGEQRPARAQQAEAARSPRQRARRRGAGQILEQVELGRYRDGVEGIGPLQPTVQEAGVGTAQDAAQQVERGLPNASADSVVAEPEQLIQIVLQIPASGGVVSRRSAKAGRGAATALARPLGRVVGAAGEDGDGAGPGADRSARGERARVQKPFAANALQQDDR